MRGDGQIIRRGRHGDFPDGLRGVDEEQSARSRNQVNRRVDILNDARLAIGRNERDKDTPMRLVPIRKAGFEPAHIRAALIIHGD